MSNNKKLTALLCVDDEDIVTDSLKTLLGKYVKNVDVIEIAHSGQEALEILEEFEKDGIELQAVIADYIMPEMKGDELLIKIHKYNPDIRKIMLTGQSDIFGIKNAINSANLYRFLEKPWNNDDILLTIQHALEAFRKDQKIKHQNIELKLLNEGLEQKVQERTQELEKMAVTDSLTGLYNRTKLDVVLETELNRFSRQDQDFSLILLDVDKFKSVNDTYGHQIGDQVLVEMANILSNHIRETDILGRWGGEEFLIVCIDTNLEGVLTLAKKLKENIEIYNFTKVGKKTASFGVSTIKHSDKIKDLIARADEALYKAKNNGRNQVISL